MHLLTSLTLSALLLACTGTAAAQGTQADYQRADAIDKLFQSKVTRANISPHWLPDKRLWYRVDTGPNTYEYVLVAADGTQRRFDSASAMVAATDGKIVLDDIHRLTEQLQPAEQTGSPTRLTFDNRTAGDITLFWISGNARIPYGRIKPGKRQEQSTYVGHAWEVHDDTGKILGFATAQEEDASIIVDGKTVAQTPEPAAEEPGLSPDGLWIAFMKDDNVWLRPAHKDSKALPLSADGSHDDSYQNSGIFWSPDSTRLVAFRTEAGQEHKVSVVSSAPTDQLQPKLISYDYLKPGDKIPHPRPVLFDVSNRKELTIADTLFPNPWSLPALGGSGFQTGVTWSADSSHFFFAYNQRGHQLMRVISVDAVNTGTSSGASASARTLFEDTSKTFIDYSNKYGAGYLPKTNEILWLSERDGWNHLYLFDATTGKLKRQLTKGEWVVSGVNSVDEMKRTMIIQVRGRNPHEDPYHAHYARLSLSNGALTPLTEADGSHHLTFSPDGSRYLDHYSRVDLPPVTELRRSSDGKRLAILEKADITALLATGWQQPERFVAKGRDGKTDIWGVVWRPTNFSAQTTYPIIEQIYAGPQGYFVPKDWSSYYGNAQQIAELGFVVVQIDGMGTNWRSKAFHDVSYKNLKDAGFPDRILWMKALGAKYPYLDLTRVGIYGGSAGGQNALAALLWHGDFYKVAVADSGCHDNRMDKIWWNEQWMGYPVDQSYADSSNVVHANQLTGKLLLTVGELDDNVDPASTMQVVNALITANKDFDLIVFPGAGHGAIDSPYGRRRRMDFFVKNLLGKTAAPAS